MKLKFENGEDIVRCNCNFQKISRQFGFQRGISMGQIDIEQEQDLMRHPHPVSYIGSGAPAPVLKEGGIS